jgi:hypothetical protein
MNAFLTDADRQLRKADVKTQYRFWLDFRLNLQTRSPTFRRWFPSVEARNQYVVDLPTTVTVVKTGEET